MDAWHPYRVELPFLACVVQNQIVKIYIFILFHRRRPLLSQWNIQPACAANHYIAGVDCLICMAHRSVSHPLNSIVLPGLRVIHILLFYSSLPFPSPLPPPLPPHHIFSKVPKCPASIHATHLVCNSFTRLHSCFHAPPPLTHALPCYPFCMQSQRGKCQI